VCACVRKVNLLYSYLVIKLIYMYCNVTYTKIVGVDMTQFAIDCELACRWSVNGSVCLVYMDMPLRQLLIIHLTGAIVGYAEVVSADGTSVLALDCLVSMCALMEVCDSDAEPLHLESAVRYRNCFVMVAFFTETISLYCSRYLNYAVCSIWSGRACQELGRKRIYGTKRAWSPPGD
jgi:hypothetical protein